MWRNHGQVFQNGERDFQVAGLNYRMTEIQAAIGRVQLEKFPEILKKRRELASQYLKELSRYPGITLPANNPEHTWQTFMVVLEKGKDRSFIISSLAESGVGAGAGSVAAHCTYTYHKTFGYKAEDLPVSNWLNSHGLALPLYCGMTDEDVSMCSTELHKISRRMK
jgi:dTDP-4-amino-4,6-dideoxygalactose transaminase